MSLWEILGWGALIVALGALVIASAPVQVNPAVSLIFWILWTYGLGQDLSD